MTQLTKERGVGFQLTKTAKEYQLIATGAHTKIVQVTGAKVSKVSAHAVAILKIQCKKHFMINHGNIKKIQKVRLYLLKVWQVC